MNRIAMPVDDSSENNRTYGHLEGNNHVSGIIKYLTQSSWSHAALYVGRIGNRESADGEPRTLVNANLGEGVVGVPLSNAFTPASAVRSG